MEALADTSPSRAVEHVEHLSSLGSGHPDLAITQTLLAMVLVCENIHPRGLDFQNQRKVVILRDVQGLTFVDIAAQVKNLAGKRPSPRTCCQYYKQFSVSRGRKKLLTTIVAVGLGS